jgi:hypothetical protein
VFNIRLSYECCQSSARHKNAGQGGKRDKPSMDKFDCHGLLLFKFAIRDDGVWVHFSINHAIKHAAYLDIEDTYPSYVAGTMLHNHAREGRFAIWSHDAHFLNGPDCR